MQLIVDKDYLTSFVKEFDYPVSAQESLILDFEKILNSDCVDAFNCIIGEYQKNILCNFGDLIEKMKEISKNVGIHEYSGLLIMFIALSKPLKDYYIERGLSLEIYRDSISDLKYKMMKCFNIYNVWGVFSTWFVGFYQLTRFGFGKLEFELGKFNKDFVIDGIKLTPDSKVIFIHIPNTGSPLDKDSIEYSLAKAKEFFKGEFSGDKVVFACRTWLLFDKHKQILKPNSNLCTFINYFTIVDQGFYPDYKETWRLFGTFDLSDYDKLPQKTSLQREYVQMMKKGEKTGWAFGVFAL